MYFWKNYRKIVKFLRYFETIFRKKSFYLRKLSIQIWRYSYDVFFPNSEIFEILNDLYFLQNCKEDYDVGVIAPYREQVQLLKKTTTAKNIEVEINTVDQYQGRDKDIIIFSCTRFCKQKVNKVILLLSLFQFSSNRSAFAKR